MHTSLASDRMLGWSRKPRNERLDHRTGQQRRRAGRARERRATMNQAARWGRLVRTGKAMAW